MTRLVNVNCSQVFTIVPMFFKTRKCSFYNPSFRLENKRLFIRLLWLVDIGGVVKIMNVEQKAMKVSFIWSYLD